MREMARHDLLFSTARSEDGEAFVLASVDEQKGRGDFGFGGGVRLIDGF